MKLIIAGSRTISPSIKEIADYVYEFNIGITEIISGGAKGVDTCAEKYALAADQPLKIFHAEWDKYGKSAGHKRNKQMAEYGDALLLIWNGTSKGSANMKKNMIDLGKKIYEIIIVSE